MKANRRDSAVRNGKSVIGIATPRIEGEQKNHRPDVIRGGRDFARYGLGQSLRSPIPHGKAVANAVEDGVGVRIKSLPVAAEKVLDALMNRTGN
jgi:hypothetical protein